MIEGLPDNSLLTMTPKLAARLLGDLSLSLGDDEIASVAWQRRSARSLLLLLLLSPQRRLDRDTPAYALWPELAPASALNNLHKAVHALRRTLEPGLASGQDSRYLRWDGPWLSICADALGQVDTDSIFDVSDRLRAQERVPTDELAAAARLAVQPLLPGEAAREWLTAIRQDVDARGQDVIVALADAALRDATPELALPFVERLVAAHPTLQAAHRNLVLLLHATGQPEQAAQQAERSRRALADAGWTPDEATASVLDTATAPHRDAAGADVEPRGDFASSADQRSGEPPLARSIPVPPTGLIGRQELVDELVSAFLDDGLRHITLVGAGGSGKTHLAQVVGAELVPAFPGGAAFVSLGPLRYAELVIPTIAAVLGVPEDAGRPRAQQLAGAIGQRPVLLVLDNVEHLLEAASEIAALLSACSGLRLLATSRQPLNIRGEHLREVGPLPVPEDLVGTSPDEIRRSPAVDLFVSRVTALAPTFVLTDRNAAIVATICQRLGGLPLALELAAARVRDLTLTEIRDGLEDQLTLLSAGQQDLPHRQQTMRECIRWSEALLPDDARILYRRLSAVAGGISRTSADWAGTLDGTLPVVQNVGGALPVLIQSSLIARVVSDDEGGTATFTMLDTVAAYGREQLRAAGEERALERKRLHWLHDLAATSEQAYSTQEIGGAFDRLDQHRLTIDAGLAYGFASDDPDDRALAEEIAGCLVQFWGERGGFRDAVRWFMPLLTFPTESLTDWVAAERDAATRRAKALRRGAMLFYDAELFDDAVRTAERVRDLYTALDDWSGRSVATEIMAGVAGARGQHDQSVRLADQAVAEAHRSGVVRRLLVATGNRLLMVTEAGLLDRAAALGEEALAAARLADDPDSIAQVALILATIAVVRHDRTWATANLDLAADAAAKVDAPHFNGRLAMLRGWFAWQAADYPTARGFFIAAAAQHHSINDWVLYIHEADEAAGLCDIMLGAWPSAMDLLTSSSTAYVDTPTMSANLPSLLENVVHCLVQRPDSLVQRRLAWLVAELSGMATRMRHGKVTRAAIEFVGVRSDQVERRLRARLGVAGYDGALAAGARRPDREAVPLLMSLLRVAETANSSTGPGRIAGPYGTLTGRELDVLRFLLDGQSNAEIAGNLFVSERTVHAHLRNVYEKLGVQNRAAAVRWAFDHGMAP